MEFNNNINKINKVITVNSIKGGNAPNMVPDYCEAVLDLFQLPEDEIKKFIEFYNKKIGMEVNGESMGCNFQDEESGELTFNVGIINLDENFMELIINIRYPVTATEKKVYKNIRNEAESYDIVLKEELHIEPLYYPVDDPLIKTLLDVYRKTTGDNSDPKAMGGATFCEITIKKPERRLE